MSSSTSSAWFLSLSSVSPLRRAEISQAVIDAETGRLELIWRGINGNGNDGFYNKSFVAPQPLIGCGNGGDNNGNRNNNSHSPALPNGSRVVLADDCTRGTLVRLFSKENDATLYAEVKQELYAEVQQESSATITTRVVPAAQLLRVGRDVTPNHDSASAPRKDATVSLFLEQGLFSQCHNLQRIIFKGTCCCLRVYLGRNVFSDCHSLVSLQLETGDNRRWSIPKGIPEGTFRNCTALRKIPSWFWRDVPDIGRGAFENCTRLTSMQLPESIERIHLGAWKGAGLLDIRLPERIKQVDLLIFRSAEKKSPQDDWPFELRMQSRVMMVELSESSLYLWSTSFEKYNLWPVTNNLKLACWNIEISAKYEDFFTRLVRNPHLTDVSITRVKFVPGSILNMIASLYTAHGGTRSLTEFDDEGETRELSFDFSGVPVQEEGDDNTEIMIKFLSDAWRLASRAKAPTGRRDPTIGVKLFGVSLRNEGEELFFDTDTMMRCREKMGVGWSTWARILELLSERDINQLQKVEFSECNVTESGWKDLDSVTSIMKTLFQSHSLSKLTFQWCDIDFDVFCTLLASSLGNHSSILSDPDFKGFDFCECFFEEAEENEAAFKMIRFLLTFQESVRVNGCTVLYEKAENCVHVSLGELANTAAWTRVICQAGRRADFPQIRRFGFTGFSEEEMETETDILDQCLSNLICNRPDITELSLERCVFKMEDMPLFRDAIRSHQHLTYIRVHACWCEDLASSGFVQDVLSHCLKRLDLNFVHDLQPNHNMVELFDQLSNHPTLQVLSLQKFGLNEENVAWILNVAASNGILRELDLSWNKLMNQGSSSWAELLPNLTNLRKLTLSHVCFPRGDEARKNLWWWLRENMSLFDVSFDFGSFEHLSLPKRATQFLQRNQDVHMIRSGCFNEVPASLVPFLLAKFGPNTERSSSFFFFLQKYANLLPQNILPPPKFLLGESRANGNRKKRKRDDVLFRNIVM